ncbi:MAG: hypothetical protein E8D41_00280 [Nitrospira sp.]|nr:MAG: hypothetical protein E8D41_00280 [Nitrospira sp.]
MQFFYNAQGLLTETRDALYPANPATTFTYDTLGRLLTTTDPLNRTTALTYDSAGNVATSTDALSRVTSFEYDVKNRLKKVIDPLVGETVYTYDGNGNLLTVKDAKNQVTTFAYDDRNRLTNTTDPLGKVEQYTYDGNDNLLTRIAPKAETISFAYDAVNQLLSKTLPDSQVTNYTYSPVGNLLTVIDPDSALTMTYDQANRLTTVKTDGSPNQPAVALSYQYDKNGQRISLTDANAVSTTTYQYDILNRLTTMTSPASLTSCQAPPSGLISWWQGEGTAFDSQGLNHGILQNGATFAPGKVGQGFQFDGFDDYVDMGTASNLLLTNTSMTLAAWVRPTAAALGNGIDEGIVSRYASIGATWMLGRTRDGMWWFALDTNGTWAPERRVTAPTVAPLNQWQYVVGVYDHSTGAMHLYVDGVEVATSTGSPIAVFATPNTHVTLGDWWTYNGAGGAHAVPGQVDDVRIYNRALTGAEIQANLAGTTCAGPTSTTIFAYDALSRRTSMTLPNGTQTTYSYDPASQVTAILHQIVASATQINKADYLYNPVGNRTSLTDRRGSQAFGYDNLDRLTSASHPLLATPQAFAYDPVGNRTTSGSVVNAGNQLTADATHSYQYDDNGNLTRKTLLATGNFTQYTYEAENRLTKVEDFVAGNPTAAATSTYRYDGLGRRIEKVANGQTKRYVYDGEDILLEYDGANVLQARYTHGPGIDEPIAVTKSSSTFFYHQDGLGTVTDLTDAAGVTAKSYSYDAYGNILESPGTVEQPYTFTGREFDSESGLYYYRERYYDPSIGRFIHADPLGILAGVNLYAYVNNNPAAFTDPLGLIAPPSPPGEDICEDIRRIRNMGWWDLVANFSEGGKWDPKRLDDKYKPYGNYHYGVLMAARDTSVGLTLRGPGAYQLLGDLWKGRGWHNGEGWPWGDSPYGDYREDQLWIREGMTDFDGGYFVHQCPNECPLPK